MRLNSACTAAAAVVLFTTASLAPCAARTAPVPQLTITLAPAAAGPDGNIPYVDVQIVAPDMHVLAGKPLLRLPLVSSNVTTIAESLEGLRVTDSTGALSLTTRDDQPSGLMFFRHWYAARAVASNRARSHSGLGRRSRRPAQRRSDREAGAPGLHSGGSGRNADTAHRAQRQDLPNHLSAARRDCAGLPVASSAQRSGRGLRSVRASPERRKVQVPALLRPLETQCPGATVITDQSITRRGSSR